MRQEIEEIFLQVCGGTGNRVYLACADHLGQGEPDFCRAHSSSHRKQHFSAVFQMGLVGTCGVDSFTGVEMPKVFIEERGYGHEGFLIQIGEWSLPACSFTAGFADRPAANALEFCPNFDQLGATSGTRWQWAVGDFPFSPIPFVGYLSEVVLGPIWGSDPWVFPKFDACHSSSRLPQAHSMCLRNP